MKQQYIPEEDKVTEQKCNFPHICKPKIIEIQDEHKKNSLISSSYKIKTYWNNFINMGLQIY
jgi:hypothetical protein